MSEKMLTESISLGPEPILADPDLEQSLLLNITEDYYVGLLDENENLPVRYSPGQDGLQDGWDDNKYKNEGELSFTLSLDLGTPIELVEIVPSTTGVWVGFIYDGSDGELFYTESRYIRIKESAVKSTPTPLISSRLVKKPESQVAPVPGTQLIAENNNNWLKIRPNDVRLQYYDFYKQNTTKYGDLEITKEFIDNHPETRYSEGYFYFVVGEGARPKEEDLFNSAIEYTDEEKESVKANSSEQTYAEIKQNAWTSLLRYLNKNTEGVNQNLYSELYDKYFVVAASKVNTATANPDNQKVLYAIRANYIDALPDSYRSYKRSFDEDSEFYSGRNYAITFLLRDVRGVCEDLARIYTDIRNKIRTSKRGEIYNYNDTVYDLEIQIEQITKFPDLLDQFLARQAFPASTSQDFLSELIREGTGTPHDHLVQIGIKDNGQEGQDVRQTISYVLFSPDNSSLINDQTNFNLFQFDPFISDKDLESIPSSQRSAVALRQGIDFLREELEGNYGSRTLHLILSYNKIKNNLARESAGKVDNWSEFLSSYSVPPVKIFVSNQPTQNSINDLRCDDLIARLNQSGPQVGIEEKLIQEKIYNDPACMANYFNQFKDDTPATSPELSKKELERKAEQADSGGGHTEGLAYLNVLYTGFFNVLDPQSLMSLILACLQKKLGLPLTAEAICEAAIVKLIQKLGTGEVEKVMLANALLNPDDPNSQAVIAALGQKPIGEYPAPGEADISPSQPALSLNETYRDAPLATALALISLSHSSSTESPPAPGIFNDTGAPLAIAIMKADGTEKIVDIPIGGSYILKPGETSGDIAGGTNNNNKPYAGISLEVIEIIKNLETGGQNIHLIPAPRPPGSSGIVTVPLSYGGVNSDNESTSYSVGDNYSLQEIESERERLISIGYSRSEADAVMIRNGYVIPDPVQYEPLLGTDGFLSPTKDLLTDLRSGQFSGAVNYSTVEDARAGIQDAENWLAWMRRIIDLQGLCELIVGNILEGLENLITDPGAFLSNFEDGWWENFIENLKKQFSLPEPTMRFPDNLMTDNHMGDYGEQLLKQILAMVGMLLGQIVQLLIRSALDSCLEENDDLGPAPNPNIPRGPSVPLPTLEQLQLPAVGDITDEELVGWIKDLLDNLTTAQVCALIRGDAADQTLYDCLSRTLHNWREIYDSGIDTIQEIRAIFKIIGDQLDLEICEVLQSSSPVVDNICEAVFNRDARCEELQLSGLTKEECEEQINRELEDLKQKVLGLSSMAFSEVNPLAGALPPVCGENGSFSVPPGVRDTMSRITDNMLEHVKGGLIDDMQALKFFATPPRAILAISDPRELTKAHQAFVDAVKDPYRKPVFTYIGYPQFNFFNGTVKYYPITYNEILHYGDHSTAYGVSRTGPMLSEGALDLQNVYLNDPNTYADLEAAAGPVDLQADTRIYLEAKNQNHSSNLETLFNETKLTPITISPSINDHNFVIAHGIQDEIRELLRELLKDPELGLIFSGPTSSGMIKIANNKVELRKLVDKKFEEMVKPMGLDRLTYPVDLMLQGTKDGPGSFLNMMPPVGTDDIGKDYLRNVYSLDAKLKDIHPSPIKWYEMLRAYTGCNITYDGAPTTFNISTEEVIVNTENQDYDFDAPVAGEVLIKPTIPEGLTDEGIESLVAQGLEEFSDFELETEQNVTWKLWLQKSPGLYNLYKIIKNTPSLNGKLYTDPLQETSYRHNIAYAFMELTLREALGLTNQRVRKIFPNFTDVESTAIQGVVMTEGAAAIGVLVNNQQANESGYTTSDNATSGGDIVEIVKSVDTSIPGAPVVTQQQVVIAENYKHGFIPLYLVFEEVFRDPDNPLNAPPEDMIAHFSMRSDPVNPELLESFDKGDHFPPGLGFVAAKQDDIRNTALYMETTTNFNPNILTYKLPFTDIVASTTYGLDGKEKTQEILDVFSSGLNADDQVKALADSLEATVSENSLLYQNVILPLQENENSQLGFLRDAYKVSKANLRNLESYKSPPGIVAEEASIRNPEYDFNSKSRFDEDIQSLLDNIYGETATSLAIFKDYDAELIELMSTGVNLSSLNSFNLDVRNFKAQIFGKLLASKFRQTFDEYYDVGKSASLPLSVDEFEERLKTTLSTYGYSALQTAYSSQMFAKLKNSRLHNRDFMRKLWNKILQSPLNSSKVDPECRQVFDQLGVQSASDKQNTETDFFNIQQVKAKIMEFYESSLCKDIYEGTADDNSARKALIDGVVKLIVKVYALEVCMASVIAWDSFDVGDILKDRTIKKIIVRNITEDFDLDIINFYAKDIMNKEENLPSEFEVSLEGISTLRQFFPFLDQSGLEYLIDKESENIAATITDIFVNSSPISTDLKLEILKNSSPELADQLPIKVSKDLDPQTIESFYSARDFEYVVDARFNNNIYTMNFGDGRPRDFINSNVAGSETILMEGGLQYSDLFGLYGPRSGTGNNFNKLQMHSLPLNHYAGSESVKPGGLASGYFDSSGVSLQNYTLQTPLYGLSNPDNSQEFLDFQKEYNKLKNVLGNADPFSHEYFQESSVGDDLNAKLGNIVFQPFVRVQATSEEEREDFKVSLFSSKDENGLPCDKGALLAEITPVEYSDFFQDLDDHRSEDGNIFKCHIDDYVPLSVWSYFYSNIFMKKLKEYEVDVAGEKFTPLKELYNQYGLKPFFKNLSFGIRMSYVSSFPITESENLHFDEFMQNAFIYNHDGLKKSKSLYAQRPYDTLLGDQPKRKILREIHIPIVEVEKVINSVDFTRAFTVGDSTRLIPLFKLGSWNIDEIPQTDNFVSLINNSNLMTHLTDSPHQFFYKNLANDLLADLNKTPEFRLIFNHLLPMRRYMAMSFLYAGEGLSKFIPEPTDVLDETKKKLKMIMTGFLNSQDYTYLPEKVTTALEDFILQNNLGTRGLEPNITKMIQKILYETPLLILKGFVEVTDPAIIIARSILEIANAIQQTVIGAIEQGLRAAKAVADAARQAAQLTLSQLEVTTAIALGPVQASLAVLPTIAGVDMSTVVTIDTDDKPINEWVLEIDEENVPPEAADNEEWVEFSNSFNELKNMRDEYISASDDLAAAEADIESLDDDIQNTLEESKKIMKDIFGSPYTLPGMWAAMLPSWIPYGGGMPPLNFGIPPFVPPIIGLGPPSTVPGMIYLVLLLIDAYEEKIHDDTYNQDDVNCEDQL